MSATGIPWKAYRAAIEKQEPDVTLLVAKRTCPTICVGWTGLVVRLSTRLPMTFYPSTPTHASGAAFSDKLHGSGTAIIKPSVEFWQWLVSPTLTPILILTPILAVALSLALTLARTPTMYPKPEPPNQSPSPNRTYLGTSSPNPPYAGPSLFQPTIKS